LYGRYSRRSIFIFAYKKGFHAVCQICRRVLRPVADTNLKVKACFAPLGKLPCFKLARASEAGGLGQVGEKNRPLRETFDFQPFHGHVTERIVACGEVDDEKTPGKLVERIDRAGQGGDFFRWR